MANKLTRNDLMSLEEYQDKRATMRIDLMAHKALRAVLLGANVGIYFEDRQTVQYQVQEMLRIERIFDGHGIEEELKAYNPLVPDGHNLKATMMVEYSDEAERRKALVKLKGIEDCVYISVQGANQAILFADEDMDRSNEEKTSAVHFLRFEFSEAQVSNLRQGAEMKIGVKHSEYNAETTFTKGRTFDSLVGDFD